MERPRIDEKHCSLWRCQLDDVFLRVAVLDLIVRDAPIAAQDRRLASMGPSHDAMRTVLRANIREINKELQEGNLVHVEVVELSRARIGFLQKRRAPPHADQR